MGRFINTTYNNTVNSLVTAANEKLQNPFTTFPDGKGPTEVTFFNINKDKSTFDKATGDTYEEYGPDSSLFYDKIEKVFLFGLAHIEIDIEQGEFGSESNKVQGECYLPPNTFKPYHSSYFLINYLKGKRILFRVVNVNRDTLDNGGNFYKIEYEADLVGEAAIAQIERSVVRKFTMLANFIGTETRCVIQNDEYQTIVKIQNACDELRNYYHDMFFKPKVQTFVYKYSDRDKGIYFYDPFMIEFLTKNGILYGSNKFEYISQACVLPQSFTIDYNRSVFRMIETQNANQEIYRVYATRIYDPMSLMTVRLEDYYSISIRDESGERISGVLADPIDCFDTAFIDALQGNKIFDENDFRYYMNITLDSFYNRDITEHQVDSIYKINFVPCKELFYMIPLTIFSLERYVYRRLKTTS